MVERGPKPRRVGPCKVLRTEAPRFMGSPLFLTDLLTDHEPGADGRARPRAQQFRTGPHAPSLPRLTGSCLLRAGTPALRFMGSPLFLTDLLTGHEPTCCRRLAGSTHRFMGSTSL